MSCTVQELINELTEQVAANPAVGDMMLVMSRDAEGNGYSPLSGYSAPSKYEPESTWSGYVLHPDDVDPEDEYHAGLPDVICLWPTN
jgi:hypothetical protein